MPITKTQHVQLFWKSNQNATFHELKSTLKIGYNWLHICGVMLVFLLYCCTFSFPLKKPNYKTPCSFLYGFKHGRFVFILNEKQFPDVTAEEFLFLNVDLTCAQCENLNWEYNSIFSATPHLSCILFYGIIILWCTKYVCLVSQRK